MFCPGCGKEVSAADAFCRTCGHSLSSQKLASRETDEQRKATFSPPLEAYETLRKVICERPPLNLWRPEQGLLPNDIPDDLESDFELAVRAYQLFTYLDLVKEKFGLPVSETSKANILILSSFDKTMESRLPIVFEAVRAAILTHDPAIFSQFEATFSRSIGDGDPGIQFHVTLANSVSYAYDWPKERRASLLMTLAGFLAAGQSVALSVFNDELDKFDGITDSIQWSPAPGPFERQLQRKEGNPLFPRAVRIISAQQVMDARTADLRKTADFFKSYRSHVKESVSLKGMRTVGEASGFMKRSFDLMEPCAALGTYFSPEMEVLRAGADAGKASIASAAKDPVLDQYLAKYEALVAHQCSGPMIIARTLEALGAERRNEEWVRPVFSEDLETIREFGAMTAGVGLDLWQDAKAIVEAAVRDGMKADVGNAKLDAFRSGIREGEGIRADMKTAPAKRVSAIWNAMKRFFRGAS